MLSPNVAMAQRFLDHLGPDEAFTFQTIFDKKRSAGERPPPLFMKVFHGTLCDHAAALTELNDMGAGIFFMVNLGDGVKHDGARTCRTAENVIAARALFVDLDGAPIAPVLNAAVPPSMVVESSPGKFHAYWPARDIPLDKFSDLQKRLAVKFDGDPVVHDLPRVMRVPGFWHQKAEPFLTRIIWPEEIANEQS
jgi:hypothetical protein